MMDYPIRPLAIEERKYTYSQSQQISMQTGFIGYLRADFGRSGNEFFSTWNEYRENWISDELKAEFDEVINYLRSDESGLLASRRSMVAFARQNPESGFKGNYATEYGFRADTEKYSYLLRCNPTQGDYNLYCYCYEKQWESFQS